MTAPDRDRWRFISPLLDELLELDAPACAQRLGEWRAHDPALADELAALLGSGARAAAERFLSGDAALHELTAGSAPTLAGERLGAYTLLELLGQGGTGSVWRARRDDGRFEGEVAIKLLHLSLLGRAGAERFQREGAILARLVHPHIARLLDAGVSAGGQPYLVLELVEGERIDHHCDTRRLSVAQRLALFEQVLAAVAHAHGQLVVHRDIKPTNILVTRDGSVKLLDFGIAKLLEDEGHAAESTAITREGGRALTPEYAAPEQLRGEPVSTATDVYALGVLLFRLLAGRHPTVPETASTAEVMRAVMEAEPARLSGALAGLARSEPDTLSRIAAERASSAARLQRQLAGDLDNIVAQALRKVPAQRYAGVATLAEDLRRHREHEPVSARPDALGYRVARFVRRHRGAVAAAALLVAVVGAGLVGTLTQAARAERAAVLAQQQAQRAETQAHQARRERDKALRDLAFAQGAEDLLGFLLGQSAGQPLAASELLARAEPLIERQFAGDAVLRARLLLMLGVAYAQLREGERTEAVLRRAQEAARGAEPALLANIDCTLAGVLGGRSRHDEALALFDGAIARLRGAPEPDDATWANCLRLRASLHGTRGDARAMLADAQAALVHAQALPTPDRLLAGTLRATLAEAHGKLGQTADAVAAYERALAELDGMGRQRTALAALFMNNFSSVLYRAGQMQRAAATAQRGLEITRGVDATPDNASVALLQTSQSRALVELGRHGEARAGLEQVLADAAKRGDRRLAGYAALYGAPAWCAAGDLARCETLLAQARRELGATLPARHAMHGALAAAEADLSLIRQRPAMAREQLQRALAIFDAAPEKNPLRIRALARLARVEQALNDPVAAREHAAGAVAAAREAAKGFEHSAWLGEALLAQGQVQQAQGDAHAAERSLREAQAQLQGALGADAPAARHGYRR